MADPTDQLLETLRDAQRLGFFGAAPIERAVEHAEWFVQAIAGLPSGSRVVDLGSGGGLPGLVVAAGRPDCPLLLIDRREKRTDFLRRAAARLGMAHVSVRTGDVLDLIRDVERDEVEPFRAVTARGFGPPSVTLTFAVRLLVAEPGAGPIVISEPPAGDRWDAGLLGRLGVVARVSGPVRCFTRVPE